MQLEKIRANLKIQQNVVRNGLKRRANAAISAGYDPAPIAQAYGLDLRELGVEASGRRGTVAPAPTTPRTIPDAAVRALQADPSKRREFDAYYGPGAADRYLRR